MFVKLRNKFVLTNLVISSIILLLSFITIYFISASSLQNPRVPNNIRPDLAEILNDRIMASQSASLTQLAVSLILVFIVAEVLVFFASYYIAEKAIYPIRQAYLQQKEFIANASHELKTPIASIQANFEALDAKTQPWTDNINSELARANQLIANLLSLANLQNNSANPTPSSKINLYASVNAEIQRHPEHQQKTIAIKIPKNLSLKLNEIDLKQTISILIDNAFKYSKQTIVISGNEKQLTIANDGATIKPDQIERIFERFYQADKNASGSGLGLAIARALANKNNWQLHAKSDKKQTSFILEF